MGFRYFPERRLISKALLRDVLLASSLIFLIPGTVFADEAKVPSQPLRSSVTLVSTDFRSTYASNTAARFFAGPLRAGSAEPIIFLPPQGPIYDAKNAYQVQPVFGQASPSAPAPLSVFTLQDLSLLTESAEATSTVANKEVPLAVLPPLMEHESANASAPDQTLSSPAVQAWQYALTKSAPAYLKVNGLAPDTVNAGWNGWYRRVGEVVNSEFDKIVTGPAQLELNFYVLNSGGICVSFINGESINTSGHLEEGYSPVAEDVMKHVAAALTNEQALVFPKGTHRCAVIFQMLLRKSEDEVEGYSPGNTVDGEVGTPLSF